MIEEYKDWEIGKFYKKYWVGRDKAEGMSEYLTYNYRNGKFNIHNKAVNGEMLAWYNSLREARSAIDMWNEQQACTKQPEALSFVTQIVKEAEEAVEKHGQFASCHEGYAVILEEVDELWDEVKKKEYNRDYSNMKKELVQIAAMCMKMYDLANIKHIKSDYDKGILKPLGG